MATALRCTAQFNTVVVFGDSLSDTGNVARVLQNQYGVRYPARNAAAGFNYTDGRFTDGVETLPAASAYLGVWIEQLAASFSGKPAVKASLEGGTNFAYGDATTQDGTRPLLGSLGGVQAVISVRNMGAQVDDYFATRATPNAQTLYVFWGGANDLLADSSATNVAAAAQREVALMQRVADAGGTNFLVMNLPPLGSVPDYVSGPSAGPLNSATVSFNTQLAVALAQFKTRNLAQGKAVTLYLGDVYSPFQTAASNPRSVGLAVVFQSAQGVAGSPDPYLIWDGLHPTTTGHHFAAAAAAAAFNTLATGRVALLVPSATAAGQTALLQAIVSSSANNTPTGLVTFYDGTAAVASATVDANGIAKSSYATANATTAASYTAAYAGDVYTNPATSTPLTAAIATVTTLSSSNLSVNLGTAITLTATVSSGTSLTLTGIVTYMDGATTLGTARLANGVAVYTTSSLAAGSHGVTAVFVSDSTFATSTSPVITQVVVAPALGLSVAPATLTVVRGSSSTATLTATASGGYSGTVAFACSNLPARMSCTFSPSSLSLTGNGTQTATVTVGTTATAAIAVPALRPWDVDRTMLAVLLFPAVLVPLRRRGRLLAASTFAGCLLMLLSGCSSGSSNSNTVAAGSYAIQITATPPTGSAVSTALQIVVQ